MIGSNMKRVIALIAASAAAVSLAACGSNSSQDSKTIEFWDPYPQKNDSSTWAKYVTNCAPEGYNVKRIGYAQSDLLNNLTTAVKAGNAPQIALIDNPKMPTAVDAGLVTDIEAAGVDVSGFDKNIEGPGIIDGVQYGVSYGTNALGLYYNPDVLNKAGVDPESITDWDSLNSAIEKVVNAGYKGITFSGISGEEGTFQFLPWFWGAGGQLKDASGSSAEQDALDLVSGWVQKGWAPKSVATDNQSAAWDLFLGGDYGFSENGSWQMESATEKGYKMISIPAKDGGVAPVPSGGEFITIPTQKTKDSDKMKATAEVIQCLIDGDNLKKTNDEMVYLAAKSDVRKQQVEENSAWAPWVDAVENAEGRTTDVGLEYEDISAQLSEDLQAALNKADSRSHIFPGHLPAIHCDIQTPHSIFSINRQVNYVSNNHRR